MRPWLRRLAALAAVGFTATLLTSLTYLLIATPWALTIVLISFTSGVFGWVLGVAVLRAGDRLQAARWQALCDENETLWIEAEAGLAKAMADNRELIEKLPKVYDAGIIAGQTFHEDRQEFGL